MRLKYILCSRCSCTSRVLLALASTCGYHPDDRIWMVVFIHLASRAGAVYFRGSKLRRRSAGDRREPDRRAGGARTQPEERDRLPTARRDGSRDRPVGEWQEFARLRYYLCRGAEALCREPLSLREAVLRPDGQAGRGPHRWSLTGRLDRPEDHVEQSPFHGGHGHGDLRLSAPPLRPRRASPLPRMRLPRGLLVAAADGGEGAGAPGEDPLHGI